MADPRASELLEAASAPQDAYGLTVYELLERLGDRGLALFLLMVALPSALPLPGVSGLSLVTGIPVALAALRMIIGKPSLWLPDRIAYKRMSPEQAAARLSRLMPYLTLLERYLAPRLPGVCSVKSERALGALLLVLAVVMALPVTGRFLPSFCVVLIALGMLEKDGIFVLCAVAFSLLVLGLMHHAIAIALSGMIPSRIH